MRGRVRLSIHLQLPDALPVRASVEDAALGHQDEIGDGDVREPGSGLEPLARADPAADDAEIVGDVDRASIADNDSLRGNVRVVAVQAGERDRRWSAAGSRDVPDLEDVPWRRRG